ncbi:MAG TPA: S8 family peptidase [Candidatus Merdisoma merdipullorum]|nr:S8 family peptidase [Candidatus Merdisoma merdipullorum]
MNRVRELVGAFPAYAQGIYGAGIGVAVLDSGVNDRHPDLQGRLVYSYNYLTGSAERADDCGHGTHICGIIGGTGVASGGRYQGLAPRCHFLSLKVLDQEGNGNSGSLVQALYWLIDHRKEYDIRIVNISVGSTEIRGKKKSGLLKAVEDAWDAGLVVCAAAGNQGPARSSITVPGTSPRVITAGSSDDSRAVRFMGVRRANYSGRGPTSACVCKPDVVAPGAYIKSCNADFERSGKGYYTEKSGTSMATPVVSGALALLLSRDRELTNKQVKLKLRASCLDLGLPRNQQGWGQIWIPGLLSL